MLRWAIGVYGLVAASLAIAARATTDSGSYTYFTNWIYTIHAGTCIIAFLPKEYRDAVYSRLWLTSMDLSVAVALLSSYIFLYGSSTYDEAVENNGETTVTLYNVAVHLLPATIYLCLVPWVHAVPSKYADGLNYKCSFPKRWFSHVWALLVSSFYLLVREVDEVYGTSAPVWTVFSLGIGAVFLSDLITQRWYVYHDSRVRTIH